MADQLRAGRVRKLLRDLMPASGAAPDAAAETESEAEAEDDGLLLPLDPTAAPTAGTKKPKKRKKPADETDDTTSDEPVDVNASY